MWAAGATGALLSYGTMQLLADRTMASAIGNASRCVIAAGMFCNAFPTQCFELSSSARQPVCVNCKLQLC